MTKFKKCEMPGCNKVLSNKNMHVIKTIPHDAEFGYKTKLADKKPGAHGGYTRYTVKHKYKICGGCYEFWNMHKESQTLLEDDEDTKDESMDRVDRKIEADLFGIGDSSGHSTGSSGIRTRSYHIAKEAGDV